MHDESYFRFITTPGIEPTNNLGERDFSIFLFLSFRVGRNAATCTGLGTYRILSSFCGDGYGRN